MQQLTEGHRRWRRRVGLAVLWGLLGLPSLAVSQSTLINGHQVIVGSENYCDTVGSGTNAYACNLLETITEYNAGATYRFLANAANTGAATLQLNSIATPRALVKFVGGVNQPLIANDILAGALVTVTYDGTSMQVQSMLGNTGSSGGTGTLQLWPGQITLPDGTTNNAFAQAQVAKSSGTTTNAANLHVTELLFDFVATDEHAIFCHLLPADYASGGTVRVLWKRNDTGAQSAANVVWKTAIAALTPGGAEVVNTKAFATVTTSGAQAAGTTGQALRVTTMTPAMDNAAALDLLCVLLGRDASDTTNDTLGVRAAVTNVVLEYTK